MPYWRKSRIYKSTLEKSALWEDALIRGPGILYFRKKTKVVFLSIILIRIIKFI